ncbi:MAG: U32 family peptidase [Methanobacteriaceae archaeon]|nr:U32 family peptidase [Methanobacteriaceae archaeon]
MLNRDLPELLAPAGSFYAFKAAVNAGADAVYLSGKRFGARGFADNFSKQEIKEAVNYAHLNNVKVYVTVNTLIKNSEIPVISEYLLWLYKNGVDAVIIQDVGIAALAKELVPDLNLHASTQMAIHNQPGVEWALDFGFKRVVLAREMKLSEIEEIGKKIKKRIELEVFAHGALCYSYSGRCLLSSLIGSRSGNRGMCAQPCRKPYKLMEGNLDGYGRPKNLKEIPLNHEYLLSTRDLALYSKLNYITSKPIDSIKIEGRMRSPEYVAIVVSIYRKALDEIKKGGWKPLDQDLKKLELTFNRMFTSGYILEKDHNRIMGRDRPGNRGIYIGTVEKYDPKYKMVDIDLKNDIVPCKGDGIVFISKGRPNTTGLKVRLSPLKENNIVKLKVDSFIHKGSKVYLNYKKSLIDEAKNIILKNAYQSIPLDLNVYWKNNLPILEGEIIGPDNSNLFLSMESRFEMEKALTDPLNKETIEKQLKKTGKTPFRINKIEIDYPGGLFLPISKLNQIRRDFLEKAESILLESYLGPPKNVKKSEDHLYHLKKNKFSPANNLIITTKNEGSENPLYMSVYINNHENVEYALKGGCKRIYFEFNSLDIWPGKDYGCTEKYLEKVLDHFSEIFTKIKFLCEDNEAQLVWKWPNINREPYLNLAVALMDSFSPDFIREIMVGDLGSAYLLSKMKPRVCLSASPELNIWNNWTSHLFSGIFKTVTLSPELSKSDLNSLSKYFYLIKNSNFKSINMELLVQGNLETIISEDCLPCTATNSGDDMITLPQKFWGLKDFKNHLFPLYLDLECRTHILNSVELCLIDYMALFKDWNVDGLVIDARNRSGNYVRDMLSLYGDAVNQLNDGQISAKYIKTMKNQIKKISLGGITKSNFLREVK